jgi:lipid-A-disaccharide synthase-like uncharacterized protein
MWKKLRIEGTLGVTNMGKSFFVETLIGSLCCLNYFMWYKNNYFVFAVSWKSEP